MPWKAIQNIGAYKEGDPVPEDKALIWKDMYKTSPVTFVPLSSVEKDVEDKNEQVSKADVNKDGKVDYKDLITVVKNLGKEHTKKELYDKAKDMDLDVSWRDKKKDIAKAIAESER